MRSVQCGCGRVQMLPDVLLCPFCRKDLTSQTDEYNRKHVERCAKARRVMYVYSPNGPGRPSRRRLEEEAAVLERHCRNCATPFCQGCDDGFCERWSSGELERCLFCGMNPVLVEKEGAYAAICDHCSLKMIASDRDELITRWNRRPL